MKTLKNTDLRKKEVQEKTKDLKSLGFLKRYILTISLASWTILIVPSAFTKIPEVEWISLQKISPLGNQTIWTRPKERIEIISQINFQIKGWKSHPPIDALAWAAITANIKVLAKIKEDKSDPLLLGPNVWTLQTRTDGKIFTWNPSKFSNQEIKDIVAILHKFIQTPGSPRKIEGSYLTANPIRKYASDEKDNQKITNNPSILLQKALKHPNLPIQITTKNVFSQNKLPEWPDNSTISQTNAVHVILTPERDKYLLKIQKGE